MAHAGGSDETEDHVTASSSPAKIPQKGGDGDAGVSVKGVSDTAGDREGGAATEQKATPADQDAAKMDVDDDDMDDLSAVSAIASCVCVCVCVCVWLCIFLCVALRFYMNACLVGMEHSRFGSGTPTYIHAFAWLLRVNELEIIDSHAWM